MSYRSLKRVLGESNLERKCRWLFGICLTLLILIAFWGVDRIGEDLVMSNAHRSGAEGVRHFLINKHWDTWDTRAGVNQLREELTRNLLADSALMADVLSLDQALVASLRQQEEKVEKDADRGKTGPRIVGPKDDHEEALLRSLRDEFDAQMAAITAASQPDYNRPKVDGGASEPKNPVVAAEEAGRFNPAFRSQTVLSEGKFYYYQPVYWNQNFCATCHDGLYGRFAISASESSVAADEKLPFLVVRVSPLRRSSRSDLPYPRGAFNGGDSDGFGVDGSALVGCSLRRGQATLALARC